MNRAIKYYVSSKLKHAQMWRETTDLNIISSWIKGETKLSKPHQLRKMWQKYLKEIQEADKFLLYLTANDVPKGALAELGAALAYGKPVVIYWPESLIELERLLGTVIHHENVTLVSNREELK